ncbi:hypothetical protein D9758_001589 [Tetrapyrgos nigripes]|uniref:Pinin/SDK/MemA protein domain-containing protein n=1 Tax=Tetrapyrgos nigripes TaxID=182062 RepID=A0A8H5LXN8_9AGAR|nr:hypothetical protein D9758_001589 [Tetrapyrgos nigripes]
MDNDDASKPTPTEPAAMASNKPRPKLDLSSEIKPGERRRGKTMFGLVLGTLNKAKIEDKERNASEAAKKRQMIEQRLQIKLRKETDSVRRAEEAKKDKTAANRKEEELQLKDSIYKLRRTRLSLLANFLCTSDKIPEEDSDPTPTSADPLAPPPRSHPPPLYYLPAILTPAQEAFIKKRKEAVTEAAEKEWQYFREERTTGIEEIHQLRQRVAEEEAKKKARGGGDDDAEMDVEGDNANHGRDQDNSADQGTSHSHTNGTNGRSHSAENKEDKEGDSGKPAEPEAESMSMDVDESAAPAPAAGADAGTGAAGTELATGTGEGSTTTTEKDGTPAAASASAPTSEKKDTGAMQADDDEAVEY